MTRPPSHLALAMALGLTALGPIAAPSHAEVTRTAAESAPPVDSAPAARRGVPRPIHGRGPLQVQCWQEGTKIIDQGALAGLSLNAVTKQKSVGFKRTGDDQPTVFVLPFEDGLCLIQPEP